MPGKFSHGRLHNRAELITQRKLLRNFSTSAEAVLWMWLKDKQLCGRKFRRQHSVGKYVLDFYCPSEKLAIELDGDHHFTDEGLMYDEVRTLYLNSRGIQVLRFENGEIFQSPEEVLEEIKRHFKSE